MKKLLFTGAALLALVSSAHSKEVRVPDVFINEWCSALGDKEQPLPPESDKDGSTMNYQAPTWMNGGPCKNIFVVTPWVFGNEEHCVPVKVRLKESVAPSGTGYTAMIDAKCRWPGTMRTFKFYRYKGNLYVTTLSAAYARVGMTFVPVKALPAEMQGTWCSHDRGQGTSSFDRCQKIRDSNDIVVSETTITFPTDGAKCKLSHLSRDIESFWYFADARCNTEGRPAGTIKMRFYIDADKRLVWKE